MSEESGKEFAFTWEIQNFSLCNQKNLECLNSPIFTAENLNGSKWHLKLYPRGVSLPSENYISCYLENVYLNTANCNLKYKIEFIGMDDKIVACQASDRIFEKEDNWGWEKFLKHEKFKEMQNKSDTLKIQCYLIRKEPSIKSASGCEAYTKVGVNRCSFYWQIKNFDSSDWSDSKTLNIPNFPQIEITLSAPENNVLIEINRKGEVPSVSQIVDCKITLLDVKGKELNTKSDKYSFDIKDTVWKFPPFISKNQLKDKSDALATDGLFTLVFELSASNGIVSNGIEKYTYDISNANSNSSPNVETYSDLHDLLHQMFVSKKHSDIKLRSGDVVFPAPKSVLSARSCVFSAMFDVDMSENQTGVVEIPDLESCTLDSFLKFLYTGTVDKMDYECASKLLVAADKYQVLLLKEKCAAFLQTILSQDNVFEILTISDMIGHKTLKKSAIDYIKVNAETILQSEEWCLWAENNFKLGIEVFCKLSADIRTSCKK